MRGCMILASIGYRESLTRREILTKEMEREM